MVDTILCARVLGQETVRTAVQRTNTKAGTDIGNVVVLSANQILTYDQMNSDEDPIRNHIAPITRAPNVTERSRMVGLQDRKMVLYAHQEDLADYQRSYEAHFGKTEFKDMS
jgi:hypothetical protein